MSDIKDSETKALSAETGAPTPEASVAAPDGDQQASLALVETPASDLPKAEEPNIELPKIELPDVDPPRIELSSAEPASSDIPVAEIAAPPQSTDAPKPIEIVETIETARLIELLASEPVAPAPAPEAVPPSIAPSVASKSASSPLESEFLAMAAAKEKPATSRANRFALLAACVAVAASVGALAGALGSSMMARPAPTAALASADSPMAALDLSQLQDTIVSVRSEMASLKASIDSGARNSNAQFAKAAERIERVERTQSASAAQLAKSIEGLDRRADPAKETTASVRPQPVAAPAPAPTPPQESSRGPVLDGWVVRNVNRNVAIIQGRRQGVIEVEAGDIVPGVGRIQSFRKQSDGKWVVVTSRGLITSAR